MRLLLPPNLDPPPPLLLVTRLGAIGAVAPAPVVPAVAPAPVPTLEQKMNLGSPDQKESFSPFGRHSCSLSAPSCPCFCSCCDPCTIKFQFGGGMELIYKQSELFIGGLQKFLIQPTSCPCCGSYSCSCPCPLLPFHRRLRLHGAHQDGRTWLPNHCLRQINADCLLSCGVRKFRPGILDTQLPPIVLAPIQPIDGVLRIMPC